MRSCNLGHCLQEEGGVCLMDGCGGEGVMMAMAGKKCAIHGFLSLAMTYKGLEHFLA